MKKDDDFLEHLEQARKIVKSWPQWKREAMGVPDECSGLEFGRKMIKHCEKFGPPGKSVKVKMRYTKIINDFIKKIEAAHKNAGNGEQVFGPSKKRSDVRAAEGAGLENRCSRKGVGGSNPSRSATKHKRRKPSCVGCHHNVEIDVGGDQETHLMRVCDITRTAINDGVSRVFCPLVNDKRVSSKKRKNVTLWLYPDHRGNLILSGNEPRLDTVNGRAYVSDVTKYVGTLEDLEPSDFGIKAGECVQLDLVVRGRPRVMKKGETVYEDDPFGS